MRSTRRSLGAASVVLVGALAGVTAAATAANAQQLIAPRLARHAGTPTAMATPATGAEPRGAAAAARAGDSVAYYLREAHVQRRDGASLLAVGLATVTVAFVQYARTSDNMGMNGGQGAALAAGAALGIAGGARLARSRDDFTLAARWSTAQVAGVAR